MPFSLINIFLRFVYDDVMFVFVHQQAHSLRIDWELIPDQIVVWFAVRTIQCCSVCVSSCKPKLLLPGPRCFGSPFGQDHIAFLQSLCSEMRTQGGFSRRFHSFAGGFSGRGSLHFICSSKNVFSHLFSSTAAATAATYAFKSVFVFNSALIWWVWVCLCVCMEFWCISFTMNIQKAPQRKAQHNFHTKPTKGNIQIWSQNNWTRAIHNPQYTC